VSLNEIKVKIEDIELKIRKKEQMSEAGFHDKFLPDLIKLTSFL